MSSLARYRRGWGRRKPPVWARLDRTHPLSRGVAGEWPLNEAAGSLLYDKSGNNLTLTAVNAPTWQGAQAGIGLRFTAASSQRLTLANNATISPGNSSYTWAYWINFTTVAANQLVIAKSSSGGTGEYFCGLDHTGGNKIYYEVANGNFIYANALGAVSANTWYYVVFWYDAGALTLNIQVNGGPVDSTASGTVTATSDALSIGGYTNGAPFFDGRMAHLAFWRRTLSTAERLQQYAHPFGRYAVPAPRRLAATATGGGGIGPPAGKKPSQKWWPGLARPLPHHRPTRW